jgi:predicted O-methyltransferase YrrM
VPLLTPADLAALEKRLEHRFHAVHRALERTDRLLYTQMESLFALYREHDGLFVVPPLRNWAISPDAMLLLTSEIADRAPKSIIELGSGSSTVVVASLLDGRDDVSFIALEHDPIYFAETTRRLRRAGLADRVDLRFAPLVDHDIDGEVWRWYEFDGDAEALDFVIVDGPPASTGPLARYPAVPLLRGHCAPRCTFFLDDFSREDEQQVVARWQVEFGLRMTMRNEIVEKWAGVAELEVGTE